ncbi:sugar ABC transporter substrate-binding protein [Salsipaludibacter albus]|uniref:sugar ABC transporter substrate-binding protein n=1 Tax=Salsipaludibacter albus TaxID=2849650 RepID=UPI001EE3D6C8|nr:extracellular solute-binding protein [Salsipaludibacter albus]MBY5164098.1 extracellular solute-binding protein [Salsipaludibacter albus]
MRTRTARLVAVTAVTALALTACSVGGGGEEPGDGDTGAADDTGAATGGSETAGGGGGGGSTGPIDIWYSNNPEEIEWAEQVIEAWNGDNPDQEVSAQELPAGDSSEEVIRAAITAGNAPCLVYNTAPAAVPSFQEQQGLVALSEFEDGASFVEERVGDLAAQYASTDGDFYQIPWKANPVMLLYNKALFEQAGLDPEDPPLGTYDEFLETSRTLVENSDAEAAIYPSPSAEFFQPWFDYYPWFAAESGGDQLVVDGEPQVATEASVAVGEVWRTIYDEGLAPREAAQGDSFADGISAMNSAGPWAVAVYADLDWGVVPPPTSSGTDESWTFSDAKSVGLYTACENRQTAWDFAKFSMSEDNDRLLLETTGQLPLRTGVTEIYADWFEENPDYQPFADQLERIVEVPVVPSSIEVWQTFRDAWSSSVIFGEEDVQPAFEQANTAIGDLIAEG